MFRSNQSLYQLFEHLRDYQLLSTLQFIYSTVLLNTHLIALGNQQHLIRQMAETAPGSDPLPEADPPQEHSRDGNAADEDGRSSGDPDEENAPTDEEGFSLRDAIGTGLSGAFAETSQIRGRDSGFRVVQACDTQCITGNSDDITYIYGDSFTDFDTHRTKDLSIVYPAELYESSGCGFLQLFAVHRQSCNGFSRQHLFAAQARPRLDDTPTDCQPGLRRKPRF